MSKQKTTSVTLEQKTPTQTKNLVKTDGWQYAVKREMKKEVGMSTGEFVEHSSKKDESKKKVWLKKSAILENAFDFLADPDVSSVDVIIKTELMLQSILVLHKKFLSNENYKEIYRTQKVLAKWKDLIIKSPTHFKSKIKADEDFAKSFYDTVENVERLFAEDSELREAIKYLALQEKVADAIGGEVNRAIAGEARTPKTRLLQKDGNLFVMSKILSEGRDFFEFVQDINQALPSDPKLIRQIDPQQLITKPIKGLCKALITRMFLGDNPKDIKMDNMLIVDRGDHYQIENIDFGNAFTTNYQQFIKEADATSEAFLGHLLRQISDLQTHQILRVILKSACVDWKKEVEETLKDISGLKAEDFERIVDNLGKIELNEVDQARWDKDKSRYVRQLTNNAEFISGIYQTFTKAKAQETIETKENDHLVMNDGADSAQPEAVKVHVNSDAVLKPRVNNDNNKPKEPNSPSQLGKNLQGPLIAKTLSERVKATVGQEA